MIVRCSPTPTTFYLHLEHDSWVNLITNPVEIIIIIGISFFSEKSYKDSFRVMRRAVEIRSNLPTGLKRNILNDVRSVTE